MSINILYPPNDQIEVPVGELMSCLSAWVSVFRPEEDFKTCAIPRYATQLTLANLLNDGPHRVFGLDVILRSIAKSHRPLIQRQDTSQATVEFIEENAIYLSNHVALSLNQNNVQGVILTQAAIDVWCQYPRTEKLNYLRFGFERLNYILGYTQINIDAI